jgi:TrmH family RNA methyltransferase
VRIRFVLHRPRSSQNIGAAARALANTGAASLWVVEPVGFDRTQAARLAAGADYVLDEMRVVRTLDEALADCVDVVMTTGREIPGALLPEAVAPRLVWAPGEAALVFGDEVRGLSNAELSRAHAVTTIPTDRKSSLNLAQAVMVYGYEVMKARATVRPLPPAVPEPLAEDRLLALGRAKTRELLLAAGFLNPQQPDLVLDELVALCRRARPTHREMELLLAALKHLERAQRTKP